MRTPLRRTPLGAVFHAELLFNSRRVAPYALMVLFSANAVFWWAAGPAITWGWATNSDLYIVRLFGGFSFMTLPFFIAIIMGDPVIRDYRLGVDPLIFSKPVSRLEYLSGKFLGNFFVLVCCMACFALTLFVLQAFSIQGMTVLPTRAAPYLKHFLFFVVLSSLALSAICFTVGTLTRNVKIVYVTVTSVYVLYIASQIAMKGLPTRLRILLDPLLFNVGDATPHRGRAAELVNQLYVSYDADMIANRVLMVLLSAACLAVLYSRFSRFERLRKKNWADSVTTIGLAAGDEDFDAAFNAPEPAHAQRAVAAVPRAAMPEVSPVTGGTRAGFRQLSAAFAVELRLLLAERSLVVLLPLATFASVLALAYYEVVPGPTYSAAYAGRTADSFLLFLLAIAVFYTGEAMHRDRELKVEPLLWSAPVPNSALLLPKFAATLLVSACASLLVGAAAVALQVYKGHMPVELLAYLKTFALVLFPGMALVIAAVMALNVLLRDKYLAYAASLSAGGALFYLYSMGYNHWLYNPLLYGLWSPPDLMDGSSRLPLILVQRVYCMALTVLFLAIAHLFFLRGSGKGLRAGNGLSARAWALIVATCSAAVAVVTGVLISAVE